MDNGETSSKAFAPLLRLVCDYFDQGDQKKAFYRLHNKFGYLTDTLISRLRSQVTDRSSSSRFQVRNERETHTGDGDGSKIILNRVSTQSPGQITLYLGEFVTARLPFKSVKAMWAAFQPFVGQHQLP